MGIWDEVDAVAGDIIEGVGDVVTGLTDAAASLFDGAAPLIGVATAGAALFVVGPGAAIPAFVAGSATSRALIRHRRLTTDEQRFADTVFRGTLPSFENIVLTNLTGIDGAAFVCPNGRGQILVNIGRVNDQGECAYDHPQTYQDGPYRGDGKLLIHELVHAWQIEHTSFLPGLVCEGISNQLAGRPYEPGAAGRPWGDYNLEQQATIVDEWFAPTTRGESYSWLPPMDRSHPFYRYVCKDVRGEPMLPTGAMASSGGAVAREFDRLDIFWVGPERQLASSWWHGLPGEGWDDHAWFSATPPGTMSSNQSVAAVSRQPDHLDVFFAHVDGSLGSQWWNAAPGMGWSDHAPFAITPPGTVRSGSPISAVARAENHLDVFWIRPDGAIVSAWWDSADGQGWSDHPHFAITPAGTAADGGGLAVVARRPNHLDVFYVQPDGSIGSQWWNAAAGMGWADHAPFTITPPGAARAGSAVAAVARTADRLDVFWFRPGGGIGSASFESATGWRIHEHIPTNEPTPASGSGAGKWAGVTIEEAQHPEFAPGLLDVVTPPDAAGEGSGLAAVSRRPDHIDVFYVQTDGAIGSQWWNAALGTSWVDSPTLAVTSHGSARAGSPVAAVARTSEHLDVFWVRPNGSIGSTWWDSDDDQDWSGHDFTIASPGAAPDHGLRQVAGATVEEVEIHRPDFDPGLFDRRLP